MRSFALAAVLLLAPAVALADGYTVPNVSPRDISMCGSLHAAQNDAGATFVNPAALSRLDGVSLSLGWALLDLEEHLDRPHARSAGQRHHAHEARLPACALRRLWRALLQWGSWAGASGSA